MRVPRNCPPASCRALLRSAAVASSVALAAGAAAQAPPPDATLDPVVVTATRQAERSFDVPASVDIIGAREIQQGQPMVNLSETLSRVPGIVANNRQNYAQDLQISSRGFGARATFGVRGIRLYQDDIPQTMPDGQGQTGSFMLLATQRLEVLRGPFSTLYGNASGGGITAFTESGTVVPEFTATAGGGSYGTWTLGGKATGIARGVGYVVAATHFETDGYRDHSAAQRDLGVVKLTFTPNEQSRVTLLATTQSQPESLDPLGLTRAQWEANPRQADPVAYQYDTRKTIHQEQGGATVDYGFDNATTLKVTGYAGRRLIRQYLAFSGATPATSSGGVTDLDRDFGGLSARVARRFDTGAGAITLAAGLEYESQKEVRQGFVNNNGQLGELRRDEDDSVTSSAAYAQLVWAFYPGFQLTAGVRGTEVRFESADHLITPQNPDDSGSAKYRKTAPVAGLLWHVTDSVNVYASYGEGFETPTFAELAYKPGAQGLNFGLNAATSQALEVGIKAFVARRHRVNLAVYAVDTDDEIVVNAAVGGRTTYKNAGKTTRRGVEVGYDGEFDNGWRAHVAYTYLRAEFANDSTTGTPAVLVPAGNRLPGVPEQTAYAELAWNPPTMPWFNAAAEVQYVSKVYVNDRNTDAAPAYTVANLRVGVEQRSGDWTLRAFARLNNVADVNYVGSVIVGDANGRYFEPSPGRNWYVGASANARF